MLTGAVGAGIGAVAGGILPDQFGYQLVGRTVAGGISGGIVSEIYGGKFWQGFAQGAGTAAAAFLFNECLHSAMEKYQQQQLQQQERFNKWVQDQGWKEVEIGGQKVLVDKTGNPINQLTIKFEGGNLKMVIAGAQIGSAAAPYFTVPHPFTYTVGLAKIGFGVYFMWKGLPSIRIESKY